MMFQTVTYAAQPLDFAIGEEVPDLAPNLTSYSAPIPARETQGLTDSLAAFLLRLAAYFQGYLTSLPRVSPALGHQAAQGSLTVIDTALDGTHEPLIKVRMNRALSRRMRWLIRRGRVERSGRMRVCNLDDQARCTLSPGQFIEYGIRVYGHSRVRVYGLGQNLSLGRRALRLRARLFAGLHGDKICLRKAIACAAPLSPD